MGTGPQGRKWTEISRKIIPYLLNSRSTQSDNDFLDSKVYHDIDVSTYRQRTWRQKYCDGWKAGAIASCISAMTVLMINITVLSWAVNRYPTVGGIGVLFSGDCARAKRINTWLQLIINVLSTILLAASNYCMQCVSAPTRGEVDRAHSKGKILDIGIPSIQNLKAIGRERRLLWAGLAISALPLHFVYNSVLFLTTQANIYSITPVNQTLLDAITYNYTLPDYTDCPELRNETAGSCLEDITGIVSSADFVIQQSGGVEKMDHLNPTECLHAYDTQYMTARGDLLVVQPGPIIREKFGMLDGPDNQFETSWIGVRDTVGTSYKAYYEKPTPLRSYPSDYPSYQWQCSIDEARSWCSLNNINGTNIQDTWQPFGEPLQYCLSERVPEQCELDFNVQFAILVIISNLAKVICMFLVVWRHDESTLITIGDAIQSFMNRPDPHTKGFCTVPDHLLEVLIRWASRAPQAMDALAPHDADINLMQKKFMDEPRFREWRPPSRRWWSAPAISRWVLCVLLYISLFAGAMSAYFTSTGGHPDSWSALRSAGLGTPVGNNILNMNSSMFITVIIANLPNVILSYVYILFNSLFTCMVAGHEWTQFARHRRTLRVTSPVGRQRSTYWLQLPYRYSFPLVVLSSLLAWLASQSLFLVRINVLDHNTTDGARVVQSDKSILSCGYSIGAIVLAIIVGTLIMLGALLLGLRKYSSDMPIASTSSAAISAACHAMDGDVDAAVLPLKWGVASQEGEVGHCCFSSRVVAPPVPGVIYM